MPLSRSLLVAALAVVVANAAFAAPLAERGVEDGRLPADVRPLAYRLVLEVNPASERFVGESEIDVALTQPRHTLWLHARDMEITNASLVAGGRKLPARVALHDDGVASLTVGEIVGPGRVTLRFRYRAKFDEATDGLYHVESEGLSYAFTQLEPLSARRMFPCFDEPGFKTTFETTLVVADEHTALANTPALASERLPNGTRRVTFAPTRPLPTYLVAIAVGPFDVVDAPPLAASDVRPYRVPLRGIATKGHGPELAYALAGVPAIVAELERYFGVPYPYEKLDIVAVPDFAAGAMENVGLVTFRDVLLLLDEKTAPVGLKKGYAEVMAHELAHQWFGNLVTMAWWDDLWLNEAFATWLATRVVDAIAPDWAMPVDMLAGTHGAMAEDALVSARRIREPIVTSGDINNAFDGITYSKGGAVISMFELWVGEETFQRAIQRYVREHADGSARVGDLLSSLSKESGRDVATPFSTFLDQAGVPSLLMAKDCSGPRPVVRVEQSRYLPLGSAGKRHGPSWRLPVCVRSADGASSKVSCALVDSARGEVPLDVATCPAWVHPNAGGAGYYRTSLARADGAALAAVVEKLAAEEQLSFASDVVAAFHAGKADVGDVLSVLEPLASSTEPVLAGKAVGFYEALLDDVLDEGARLKARARVAELYRPVLTKAGGMKGARPDEGWRTKELRALAARALVDVAEDPAAENEAAALGRAYLGLDDGGALHPEAVAPDLAGIAAAAAVTRGGAVAFDALARRLATEANPLVRTQVLEALAGVKEPTLLESALMLSLDERLRVNEMYGVLATPGDDPRTREAAWAFMKARFDDVAARLSPWMRSYLPYAGAGLCSEESARDVDAFFRPRLAELPGAERPLAQTLEGIRLCTALRAAHGASADERFLR